MKKFRFSVILIILALTSGCRQPDGGAELAGYVDPFIGTGGHGHVFLGASVPYGAVQLGPCNFIKGWDWCSGYHYSDSVLTGFSHTHLSGTGIGDLGDVHLMPYTGTLRLKAGTQEDISQGYASYYNHSEEEAGPGKYSVALKSFPVFAELTATERAGFHRYTFTGGDTLRIIIDLERGIGWDRHVASGLQVHDESTLTGFRFSKGWADDQRLFFAIRTNAEPDQIAFYDRQLQRLSGDDTTQVLKGVLTWFPGADRKILVKVGISPVSGENALENVNHEIPHWDFDKTAVQAREKWNRELSRIRVQSADTAKLRTFYTSMYHLMIHPSLFCDVNGEYRGADNKVYKGNFQNYTVFSLWDTYRAAHPLYTLLDPERVVDFVNSMLAIFDQQGMLPVWHLMGNETGTMVGNHSIPVIADAILKNLDGFDREKAWKALTTTASSDDGDGLKYLIEKGWVAADSTRESVSKGLEYAVDDWAIAQVANYLGKKEDFAYYSNRSNFYRNYFDPTVGFFRGKNYDGSWSVPFHPVYTLHEQGNYTEGNAWQYLWMVPTDVEGLIELTGGEERFTERLDSLFLISSELNEGASPDISGLIGQYAHGNEPSHHIAYLYAYAGQQWKTAKMVRTIMENLYHDTPEGICGNEDCGQMSAWYIFSSLGFYPVNPANSAYVLGSPLFEEATLTLPNGKQFTVKARNNKPGHPYIQSALLNGSTYEKSYITHKDILRGGILELEMGAQPNGNFGKNHSARPTSLGELTRNPDIPISE